MLTIEGKRDRNDPSDVDDDSVNVMSSKVTKLDKEAFVRYWLHQLPQSMQDAIRRGDMTLEHQVHAIDVWLNTWIVKLPTPALINILQRLDTRAVMRFCVVSKAFRTFCHKHLQKHRDVYTFGSGEMGKLGDGNPFRHNVGTPLKMEGPFQRSVVGVSCGTFHTALWTLM